jgi:peroxiredoxin
MSLASQLSAVYENFQKNAPAEAKEPIISANKNFQASFQRSSAIQVGDVLPEFRLSDARGHDVTSTELLIKGPLLINFYRGEWCPFCDLALAAMQKHLDELEAKGVTLVAISPELPNQSLSTVEKHALRFPVLSDVGNKYAKQLGILFQQPDTLRPVFDKFGHDLKRRNGDDSLQVPIPAVLLVDRKGVVRNTFIEPDYTKRLEPSVALEWIDALQESEAGRKS